jgi:predicted nucleic acid-binding protein
MTHLLDKSAYEQGKLNRRAADRISELAESGLLAVSTAVMLEILYSARNRDQWTTTRTALDGLDRVEPSDPYAAVETQARLVDRGQHRTSIIDVMVATAAAEHGLTVLHYDRDYERLSEVTGAEQEWIVPPGDGHKT